MEQKRETLSIMDVIQIRLALEQIENPSDQVKASIANLDMMILDFTTTITRKETH